MSKRVLIACPTMGINPDPQEWLSSLINIFNSIQRCELERATFFPYKQLWWEANNQIWDVAFEHCFDYILRIDDDIHGVPQDAFENLFFEDKEVIGAAYPNRRFPYRIQALNKVNKDLSLLKMDNNLDAVNGYFIEPNKVIPVDLVGFGMTLIKVSPFRYLDRPMYKKEHEEICPDDSYFAQICLDNQIQQYVHTGVQLKHRHVSFANAGHLFNADVLEHGEKEQTKELTKV